MLNALPSKHHNLAAGTSVAATIPTANTVITAATGGVAFSILTICAVGLFWFDKSWILILYDYALFVLLWQRELKTPALNEVDDLDTIRGIVGVNVSRVTTSRYQH
jgi:hypothetical protein